MDQLAPVSPRPGYPHPVSTELENSGIRAAVGDCSVTERRRWRPPYQTGKTVRKTSTLQTQRGRTHGAGVCDNVSVPLCHSANVVTRIGIHIHTHTRQCKSGEPGLVDLECSPCTQELPPGHMSERFFRSNRPGYPHPVSSELENSGIRVAVGDCSVTERRRWRPPYQTELSHLGNVVIGVGRFRIWGGGGWARRAKFPAGS